MKHKKGLIVFTALFSVAVFLGIFLMMWFWGDEYTDFDPNIFREEVSIPGLNEGACPQGLATSKHRLYNSKGELVYYPDVDGNPTEQEKMQEYYFVSAYFKDKPSRIYVTGRESGYLGYVSLYKDGEPFYGHVGGIATNGTVFWIGSERYVYCIKRTSGDLKNAVDEIILNSVTTHVLDLNVETTTSFMIDGNAAFVSYYKSSTSTGSSTERLYVGEFYRAGNYETSKKHHITLPDGTVNRAFMYEFNVSSSTEYGLTVISDNGNISKQVPKVQKIYSIPDRIQGVARVSGSKDDSNGDTLILSQSYGLDNSQIILYNYNTIENGTNNSLSYSSIVDSNGFEYPDVTTLISGRPYYDTTVSVYYVYGNVKSKTVDSEGKNISPSFIRSYSLPSMSEGLAVSSDDRVNILFESSASKYKPFVRQSLDKVYSFRPSRSGK